MAFNFFGALGAIGRMLPGYMQGQRQAIQDNWNDLNMYNQVQGGQIQNAFDEAAFNPRLTQMYDQAANSRMGVGSNAMDYLYKQALFPGQMDTANISSMTALPLAAQNAYAQFGQGAAAGNLWNAYPTQQYYAGGGNAVPQEMNPSLPNYGYNPMQGMSWQDLARMAGWTPTGTMNMAPASSTLPTAVNR